MRTLSLLISFLAISIVSRGQRVHVGLFAGSANYSGELNDKIFSCDLSNPVYEITGNYEITEKLSLRAGISFGHLSGADRYSKDSFSLSRNLSFKTKLTEFSLMGEANLLSLYVHRYTPYVFAGLALYHFDPYAFDQKGEKAYLRPLSTEGQGLPGYSQKTYGKTQLAIPFGGGIKFALTDNLRLGVEVGLRKLFTDYLDDVSTVYISQEDLLRERGPRAVELAFRGDEVDPAAVFPQKGVQRGGSQYKDWYYFGGLHLTYRIGGEPSGGGGRKGKKSGLGCPSNVQRFY